jgi:hypothetical protein
MRDQIIYRALPPHARIVLFDINVHYHDNVRSRARIETSCAENFRSDENVCTDYFVVMDWGIISQIHLHG